MALLWLDKTAVDKSNCDVLNAGLTGTRRTDALSGLLVWLAAADQSPAGIHLKYLSFGKHFQQEPLDGSVDQLYLAEYLTNLSG